MEYPIHENRFAFDVKHKSPFVIMGNHPTSIGMNAYLTFNTPQGLVKLFLKELKDSQPQYLGIFAQVL